MILVGLPFYSNMFWRMIKLMNDEFFKVVKLVGVLISGVGLVLSFKSLNNSNKSLIISQKSLTISCQSHPDLRFCQPLIQTQSTGIFKKPLQIPSTNSDISPEKGLFLRTKTD